MLQTPTKPFKTTGSSPSAKNPAGQVQTGSGLLTRLWLEAKQSQTETAKTQQQQQPAQPTQRRVSYSQD